MTATRSAGFFASSNRLLPPIRTVFDEGHPRVQVIEKYADLNAMRGEANDIDLDLLGQVDDQVLKDIGVRRRPSIAHSQRDREVEARVGLNNNGQMG